jgi:hypothetical protein
MVAPVDHRTQLSAQDAVEGFRVDAPSSDNADS